jgi:beta-glucanase (GH16 family)
VRSRASRPGLIIAGGLVLLLGLAGVVVTRSELMAAPVSWTKIWAADLSGPAGSAPAQSQWTYQTGNGKFGNGEIETMTNSPRNVYVNGSDELDITALLTGGAWTSGRIKSATAFTPPAGGEMEVTASIWQPDPVNGLGYWPAFWLLGQGSWPAHGEIDILEDVNALSEHSGAVHCGNLTQHNADGTLGPCHEYSGFTSHLRPCSRCQDGFHTYSVIIDRRDPYVEQIRWYLDGQEFFAVAEPEVGAATWDEAFDHGFSIIFDLAMGGSYPDSVCHCTTPSSATSPGGTLRVRDVAVYEEGLAACRSRARVTTARPWPDRTRRCGRAPRRGSPPPRRPCRTARSSCRRAS